MKTRTTSAQEKPVKVGDRVTFVNDYGVRFPGKTITKIEEEEGKTRYFYKPSDSPWFGVRREQLRLEEGERVSQSNVTPLVLDPYQVNALVSSSWGCEQTNVDFYRIVARKGDWVSLQPVGQKIHEVGQTMQGTCTPDPEAVPEVGSYALGWPCSKYTGKALRRRLCFDSKGRAIGFSIKHGWASVWDGAPSFCSSYA